MKSKKVKKSITAMPAGPPPKVMPNGATRWSPEDMVIFDAEYAAGGGHRAIAARLTKRLGRYVSSNAVSHTRSRMKDRVAGGIVAPPTPVKGNAAEKAAEHEYELVKRLVGLTKKPATLEALCNTLDVSPSRLRGLADAAQKSGFRVAIEGEHIGRPPSEPNESRIQILVKPAVTKHVVAAVGDIHFGSKYHLGPQFKDFCDSAYERGVRRFLFGGDLLDGVYKHSRWEQTHHGFEEQSDYAVEHLPKYKDANWDMVLGNHDETFTDESGLDVGRALEDKFKSAGRNDLRCHGARGAYLQLRAKNERRGMFVELWHPRGSARAYAKSYRPQRKIEGYAPGQKPDLLLVNHFHQSLYMVIRGVHVLSTGCWQGGGSSFGKSLGGAPDIGSWIVEYALTKDGTIRDFSPTWISYYEKETVREVALG